MSKSDNANERMQNLIRQAQEKPHTDFVLNDRCGDTGVVTNSKDAINRVKPVTLAKLFNLK